LLKTLVNLLLHPCPLLFLHVLRNHTLGYFCCAVPAIQPREEADSAFEFDVALDLHDHLHPREIELGHAARFRRRLRSVCRRPAEIELSLHDRRKKLLLVSRMNFPMASMSTDNHCERWNETSLSPFEEEWLGGDFYCGR
jgi:hypothetical protein